MKFITTAAVAAVAAVGVFGTAIASADDPAPAIVALGAQGTVIDGPGLQGWTVSDLRPSSDAIGYQPHGSLWEATATDEALQGSAIPIIANFSAHSAGGQTYPALFSVATSQGVSPGLLGQGQRTTGKVYFDVTGDAPNAVVYQAGGAERIKWEAPAPRPQAPAGGSAPAHPAPAPAHPAPAPAQPAPAAPAHPATPSAPAAGSPKTPATGGSAGTPLPAEAPESAGSPSASGGSAGTPKASAGSSGAPLPAEAP